MLQVFRLVSPGRVDKMIAFDALPKRFLTGIKKRDESATRPIRDFLKTNGCIDKRVNKFVDPDTKEMNDVEYTFPFTYVLEYQATNQDREKWIEIVNFVRRVVDPSVRLMDKIEDMAAPCAKDSNSEWDLEPESIPVIPIPSEILRPKSPEPVDPLEVMEEKLAVQELVKKKRGRPKKVVEEVPSV